MFWKNPGRFGPISGRSGRFSVKGESSRPGVFIWGMGLRYRIELTLILL